MDDITSATQILAELAYRFLQEQACMGCAILLL
jgi:hypothetical protein